MVEKRFEELNERAYERGYNTFSDFLNMEEQSVLKSTYLPCVLFGGYPMAERVVAGFGENLSDEKFPITCICAKPLMQKCRWNLPDITICSPASLVCGPILKDREEA